MTQRQIKKNVTEQMDFLIRLTRNFNFKTRLKIALRIIRGKR